MSETTTAIVVVVVVAFGAIAFYQWQQAQAAAARARASSDPWALIGGGIGNLIAGIGAAATSSGSGGES